MNRAFVDLEKSINDVVEHFDTSVKLKSMLRKEKLLLK
jgi:hypothetical protein